VNRNGFMYVLDRTDGKLIAANQYITKQTWAKGIDESGRPIPSEITDKVRQGQEVDVWPGAMGGKNWSPTSFDPQTGLVYANTLNFGMHYKPTTPEYRAGLTYWGADISWIWPDGARGGLKAIDPLTGKAKWEALSDVPRFSGVLSTGGGVVFSGKLTGELEAFDADNGNKLWQFKTGSGIEGQPVTWQQDGVQYVAVSSGIGGVYDLFSGDERLSAVPAGGSLWVFALAQQ
jgi:alcohol dehydrogenase (cytochrome c)